MGFLIWLIHVIRSYSSILNIKLLVFLGYVTHLTVMDYTLLRGKNEVFIFYESLFFNEIIMWLLFGMIAVI